MLYYVYVCLSEQGSQPSPERIVPLPQEKSIPVGLQWNQSERLHEKNYKVSSTHTHTHTRQKGEEGLDRGSKMGNNQHDMTYMMKVLWGSFKHDPFCT